MLLVWLFQLSSDFILRGGWPASSCSHIPAHSFGCCREKWTLKGTLTFSLFTEGFINFFKKSHARFGSPLTWQEPHKYNKKQLRWPPCFDMKSLFLLHSNAALSQTSLIIYLASFSTAKSTPCTDTFLRTFLATKTNILSAQTAELCQ